MVASSMNNVGQHVTDWWPRSILDCSSHGIVYEPGYADDYSEAVPQCYINGHRSARCWLLNYEALLVAMRCTGIQRHREAHICTEHCCQFRIQFMCSRLYAMIKDRDLAGVDQSTYSTTQYLTLHTAGVRNEREISYTTYEHLSFKVL